MFCCVQENRCAEKILHASKIVDREKGADHNSCQGKKVEKKGKIVRIYPEIAWMAQGNAWE